MRHGSHSCVLAKHVIRITCAHIRCQDRSPLGVNRRRSGLSPAILGGMPMERACLLSVRTVPRTGTSRYAFSWLA